MNIYFVVTCIAITWDSKVEFRVSKVCKTCADAEIYIRENKGAQPEEHGFEIQEVKQED